MNQFWKHWKKEFSRHMTIMVVPHGIARPRQLSFSIPFIFFLFFCWTGLTAWAGYLASQHFDYWRVKADAHFLKLKVNYFASEVKRAREMLDEVKEIDSQLRNWLRLGSREAIIQSDDIGQKASGGPSANDMADLQKLLDGRVSEMSLQEVSHQVSILRTETERRLQSFREIVDKIQYERSLYRATPSIWPSPGYLTSHFGPRLSPINGLEDWHKGVDVAVPPGTPIRATADGIVQFGGWAGGYGKLVVVNHGFGYATRYGHNRQVLVKRGDKIKRGQIIALAGSTGNTTGPHCHYEVYYMGRCVNPRRFMRYRG
ncbi:MAG TPA: M23 family metallopeptidase [Elusimicrobiota bacterium]|nr:M23 family metallopeptidase [Elusimicrobiota bacterium]